MSRQEGIVRKISAILNRDHQYLTEAKEGQS
jgi:hypothetical protein